MKSILTGFVLALWSVQTFGQVDSNLMRAPIGLTVAVDLIQPTGMLYSGGDYSSLDEFQLFGHSLEVRYRNPRFRRNEIALDYQYQQWGTHKDTLRPGGGPFDGYGLYPRSRIWTFMIGARHYLGNLDANPFAPNGFWVEIQAGISFEKRDTLTDLSNFAKCLCSSNRAFEYGLRTGYDFRIGRAWFLSPGVGFLPRFLRIRDPWYRAVRFELNLGRHF